MFYVECECGNKITLCTGNIVVVDPETKEEYILDFDKLMNDAMKYIPVD